MRLDKKIAVVHRVKAIYTITNKMEKEAPKMKVEFNKATTAANNDVELPIIIIIIIIFRLDA
jgi:hypothetical protein